jgi:hypothetical protein
MGGRFLSPKKQGMLPTADVHDHITDARLPEPASVVDDAAALDATVDVLDAHAATSDAAIGGFLAARAKERMGPESATIFMRLSLQREGRAF